MLDAQNSEQPSDLYSVSDLNLAVRALLDEAFDVLWIQGEISNFSCPRSGHWYFTLKDSKSQVKCAMFRGANWKVGFQPENGMEIMLQAKVSLYPERGDYQLIGQQMQVSGEGQLQQAFEQLKKKLEKEGLFKQNHKQELPEYPKQIAIITSSTGAAIQDIRSVLERRYPILNVHLYPVMVQGQGAAQTIVQAINRAQNDCNNDVILLARGGGSLEDLWCFNEEPVARAIFDSSIPIVTGIGHESDFTIADFVADYRAPTPSVAAETVTPDIDDLQALFFQYSEELDKAMWRLLDNLAQTVDHLEKRLVSPEQMLRMHKQRLENCLLKASNVIQNNIANQRLHFSQTIVPLQRQALQQKLAQLKAKTKQLLIQNHHLLQAQLKSKQAKQVEIMRTLHAVSPLATLDRGYSITTINGKSLSPNQPINIGDTVQTKTKDKTIESTVQSVESQ